MTREEIIRARPRHKERGDGRVSAGSSKAQGIMSDALDEMVATLEKFASPPDTGVLIAAISRIYGLAHVSYFAPTIGDSLPAVNTITIPRGLEKAFLPPEAVHSFATARGFRFAAFDWTELPDRALLITVNGFTVPLATPDGGGAVFSVASRGDKTAWAERMKTARSEILRLAEFVHRHAMSRAGLTHEPATLAPLELKVLQVLANTADPVRMHDQLGLAETTFRMVTNGARHKLGALTTAHAIFIAMNRGLI